MFSVNLKVEVRISILADVLSAVRAGCEQGSREMYYPYTSITWKRFLGKENCASILCNLELLWLPIVRFTVSPQWAVLLVILVTKYESETGDLDATSPVSLSGGSFAFTCHALIRSKILLILQSSTASRLLCYNGKTICHMTEIRVWRRAFSHKERLEILGTFDFVLCHKHRIQWDGSNHHQLLEAGPSTTNSIY
jgi:hypothetical protein